MNIGLVTTLDHNIGDDFIREGLLSVVRTLAPATAFKLTAVNKHLPHTVYPWWHPMSAAVAAIRPRRRQLRARALARKYLQPLGRSRFDCCDIVLQCGTPILWEQSHRSEWAEPIWRDVLARLGPQLPVLNLGGGSCYPWERPPISLVGDEDEEFARLMVRAASLTTVRDPLAAQLLASVGGPSPEVIPCPASLAGQVFTQPVRPTRRVLVNYMHGGAHQHWHQAIDPVAWEKVARSVVTYLRRDWEVTLLCHNAPEATLAAHLWPDLPRVHPNTPREYFLTCRDAAFGVFNRLHAGVALSGLGIPSVCIGTDTRLLMAETVGLPIHYVGTVTTEKILADVDRLAASRDEMSRCLLQLRTRTFARYCEVLAPWITRASRRG